MALDARVAAVRDLLGQLMDAAAGRADYADVRHTRLREESIAMRNGELDELDARDEEGFGVRVLLGGAWGFAAARGSDRTAAEDALARALAIAEAQPRGRGGALTHEPAARGRYLSPVATDPFAVSLDEKLALLHEADRALRTEPRIAVALTALQSRHEEKLFVSTEGALCEQQLTDCGGVVSATAVRGDDAQTRSYPASHAGSVAQAGWEHVLALELPANAPRVAEEAATLLDAPRCPEGPTTLVLAGEQLGLQIHESVGHAVELDRVLGYESSYAGTSWVPATGIDTLRYGSGAMSITADATVPGAVGSYRWDDEGVPAQATPIVRDGVLRGFLSDRGSAAEIGLERSGGCARAEGFARQPLVRMSNVSLDPGQGGSLHELLSEIERGVYIDTNRSWSIDSRRLHFQFGGEAAHEIVDGQLGRLLRDPLYAGVTPDFWGSLDAVCSAEEWGLVSFTDCGKGEPGQVARVAHGCAPARFRGVQVGAG
ncbi:MAG TPA: TldD/PmbA family protein [Thermoleophilaceae bacterium]|nr:TldD/PmbA family protein [Thermoleophilaceae bacterium]